MMTETREITNSEDIIDSRDVIERIAYLESLDDARDEDDTEELARLVALAEEGESLSDWQYGVALIRDSYFKDYAMDLAEEIGAIDADASWPNSYIDWDRAADALQMDYTSISFDGVDYWAR